MNKFGNLPAIQWDNYKISLSKAVFLPLPFYEEKYEKLDEYFDSLLLQIYGLNQVLDYNEKVIEVAALLEGARIESKKENCNDKVYRKAILDAFNLVKSFGGV